MLVKVVCLMSHALTRAHTNQSNEKECSAVYDQCIFSLLFSQSRLSDVLIFRQQAPVGAWLDAGSNTPENST